MSRRDAVAKGRGGKLPPFVKLPVWVLQTAAWRDLDPVARALYVELRQRYNGSNNGRIGFGCREAAEAMNVGRNVANRGFVSLEAHGFIRPTAKSSFNTNGRRATEWLLTEERDDRNGQLPPKDFARWGQEKTKASPAGGTLSPAHGTQRVADDEKTSLRHAGGTQSAKTPKLASHPRDTYRSTIGTAVVNGAQAATAGDR